MPGIYLTAKSEFPSEFLVLHLDRQMNVIETWTPTSLGSSLPHELEGG